MGVCNASIMALKIEDPETETLAAEVARMTGGTEVEAVRESLRDRRDLLARRPGQRRPKSEKEFLEFMESRIWSQIPDELLDQPSMTKAEKEEILGYGLEGV